MTMGHRVAILKEGGFLQQVDTPRNLYDRPANAFVAGFIGSPAMNLRKVEIVDGGAKLGNIVLPLQASVLSAAKQAGLTEVTLGIRPESFQAGGADDSNTASGLKIDVTLVEELGADAYVYGNLTGDGPGDKKFIVRFDGRVSPRIGETIAVNARTDEEHAFHPQTGERLG